MTDLQNQRLSGLPDPIMESEFYADIPTKRLIAWAVDVVLISLITALLTFLSFFTALFFLPVLYATVSFLYRWVGLSRNSATLGMRLVAIEFKQGDGSPFDATAAFLHTTGYIFSAVTFPLQLISIAMMLITERKQGLTDMIMGTAAVNRRAD